MRDKLTHIFSEMFKLRREISMAAAVTRIRHPSDFTWFNYETVALELHGQYIITRGKHFQPSVTQKYVIHVPLPA